MSNDLTAFQNKVTDEDIISVDADTAMAAIAEGYNRGLAESNGVAYMRFALIFCL